MFLAKPKYESSTYIAQRPPSFAHRPNFSVRTALFSRRLSRFRTRNHRGSFVRAETAERSLKAAIPAFCVAPRCKSIRCFHSLKITVIFPEDIPQLNARWRVCIEYWSGARLPTLQLTTSHSQRLNSGKL